MEHLGLHLAASAVALVTALPLTTSAPAAATAGGPSPEHRASTTTFGGNWAMTTTEILTQTQPPETVDTRVCSGKEETLDESTCTPWTRIFTGNPVLPTEPQDWGPLKSKRGSASAIGKVNGSGLSATLTDRSRATSTCAWALATVTAVGVTTKHTLRACNESKVRLWKHPGLGEAKVKACSGSRARAAKRTCRSASFS